jgi:hypothetical protein
MCLPSQRHRPLHATLPAVARDDSGVITFIQAHMALNPRHGFGLLYDSARHQGKPWGRRYSGVCTANCG